MENGALLPHLFRTEYARIVSVLAKRFGFAQIEIAEDIASDTFLTAAETWGLKGLPANPKAWLYHVAKNKARTHLQRGALFESKIAPVLKDASTLTEEEIDLSPQNMNDSQLQMMFAICHPSIPAEAQIGLSLRILCGFGIGEIADAFLTGKETINKRLYRAKEKLRTENIRMELPAPAEMDERLGNVLTTIYLLFNEGYYSTSTDKTLRRDICLEAMRLCYMLVESPVTGKPAANALLSLMCFHASRFDARVNDKGELVLYEEQDTSLWDADLVRRGEYFLNCAATGNRISKYHLEAAIAYWHTHKEDTSEKWERILQLYNQLLQLEYSPLAALNRTYALYKASCCQARGADTSGEDALRQGTESAIREAEKLALIDNHFYFTLLGELYKDLDTEQAKAHFQTAISLAKTDADRQTIQKKLDRISPQ